MLPTELGSSRSSVSPDCARMAGLSPSLQRHNTAMSTHTQDAKPLGGEIAIRGHGLLLCNCQLANLCRSMCRDCANGSAALCASHYAQQLWLWAHCAEHDVVTHDLI